MGAINMNTILQLVTMIGVGIIGFFVKRELESFKKADEENKSKVNELEKAQVELMKSLAKFKEDVGKEFVRKEDFLQVTGQILSKLDKVFDMLYEMKGGGK